MLKKEQQGKPPLLVTVVSVATGEVLQSYEIWKGSEIIPALQKIKEMYNPKSLIGIRFETDDPKLHAVIHAFQIACELYTQQMMEESEKGK